MTTDPPPPSREVERFFANLGALSVAIVVFGVVLIAIAGVFAYFVSAPLCRQYPPEMANDPVTKGCVGHWKRNDSWCFWACGPVV